MVQTRRDHPAPAPNPAALEFLLTRRSRPARTLVPPVPDRAALSAILTAGARCPDHGKLAPWRFVVLRDMAAREELAATAVRHLTARGEAPETIEKNSAFARHGGLVIAVIASPKVSQKIPRWEQELAAAGACLSLLNAALASGWGANWLTGPLARDANFLAEAFGAAEGEFVAGFIHIGNETIVPADRERPNIDAITTWR